MREILFRGKRTDTGEWVIGQLARYNSRLDVANMVDEHEMLVPVHTKTVGQFTELTDRNGTKIFDGDIIIIFYESDGEDFRETKKVHYNPKECCWYPMRWDECCEYCDHYTEVKSIEVIGNIHDNENLLE